ncbi:hypothetical protein [Micromonospora ureilytica]|uniref:Uncharacterized protein n=1 Tax=Micromonospora ureilytica TaxID=709868 RepID=A0ABS0JPQ2_9ACTN|nr:hypothetical protein [Micromonospora ureilytica]MBG6068934.1 hypothetical protein [Micromonospora ureilytica]WSR57707.1 hypothetical protein OG400_05740 [Micromonospora ureilytica]
MREVNEEFLVGLAEIAATLFGTFLVGVFFYLDSGQRRARQSGADRYVRSGVRGVFLLTGLPLVVPLALANLDPIWGTLAFVVLGALLVAASADSLFRILRSRSSRLSIALAVNEAVSSVAVLFIIATPWVLGGWLPPPSAFVPSLVLALGSAFLSTVALVMTLFDPPPSEFVSEVVK